MKKYKELEVWQRAILLGERTYHETKVLPSEERVGMMLNRLITSLRAKNQ